MQPLLWSLQTLTPVAMATPLTCCWQTFWHICAEVLVYVQPAWRRTPPNLHYCPCHGTSRTYSTACPCNHEPVHIEAPDPASIYSPHTLIKHLHTAAHARKSLSWHTPSSSAITMQCRTPERNQVRQHHKTGDMTDRRSLDPFTMHRGTTSASLHSHAADAAKHKPQAASSTHASVSQTLPQDLNNSKGCPLATQTHTFTSK